MLYITDCMWLYVTALLSCVSMVVLFEYKPMKVMVEFSLEQPKGGIHFVIPPGSTTDTLVSDHDELFYFLPFLGVKCCIYTVIGERSEPT